MTISFPEPERQVLIALIELAEPYETPNNTHYTFHPTTLEEAATYFRGLRMEWTTAIHSLLEQGFLIATPSGYALTASGISAARKERQDHPPIWYWYREFFPAANRSLAYHRFCEQLYGRDLCQAGFSDLAEINFLIAQSGLDPSQKVLDVGCGSGEVAEYLSDQTGARVMGIDYVPEAIEIARRRTARKRYRLDFAIANLDHLEALPGTFDLLISIDTLYMPNNLPDSLRKMRGLLAPGGKILILYTEMAFDSTTPRDILTANGSGLAQALREVGWAYQAWDRSEALFHLLRRKYRLAEEMRSEFESEGSLFLYEFLRNESDSGNQPFHPATKTASRFLYQVTTQSMEENHGFL